jgi:hypothetical protein
MIAHYIPSPSDLLGILIVGLTINGNFNIYVDLFSFMLR